MQRAANVKAGRMLGNPISTGSRQWRSRRRLLVGQRSEQGFDLDIAFTDLLEQKLIGREVLLKREQVLGPIVARERGNDLGVRGVTAGVAMGGEPLGVAPPLRMSRTIVSPVWPVMSASTVWSLRFISLSAFCMR